jgi:hypothetical protein
MSTSRSILFVAEMGGGFGHVRRLLPVARAARAAGLRPQFVAGNLAEVSPLLACEDGGAGFEVRGPPRRPARAPPPGTVAVTFADVLAGIGFDDRAFLLDAARAWDALLDEIDPVAIVCELSPLLCLATHGGPRPVLSLGHGFVLPPPHLPAFPRLWDALPFAVESDLLEHANHACRARGRPPLVALPRLLAGTAHAVTGFGFLDPYREARLEEAVGPPALDARLSGADSATEDVFAYLFGGAPSCDAVLGALARCHLRGRAFVRGGSPAQRQILRSSGVAWLDEPEAIQRALDRARVVVHHGSMLTAEEALVAGRPQVVAPVYLEHLLTARALAARGLATVVRPSWSKEKIAGALIETAISAPAAATARAFAEALAACLPASDLPTRLLGRALPQLSGLARPEVRPHR